MAINGVCGLGTNDSNYKVTQEINLGDKRKQTVVCPFYRAWRDMLKRCDANGAFQKKYPTYAGCSVVDEWVSFSSFKEWMVTQQWEGGHLDKDILNPTNKVYGPDTCVFVSGQLNNFLTNTEVGTDGSLTGAYWNPTKNRYIAQCRNPFTGAKEHVGTFKTAADAHEAWRKRKHELACIYADMQTDERLSNALRTRYAAQEGK